MASPFVGMNPYMEDREAWAGVHLHILANLAQQLAPQIRPRYRVHTERYLTIGEEVRKFHPDLRVQKGVASTAAIQPAVLEATSVTLVTENLFIEAIEDHPPYLEIMTPEGEVVTVIEVLSFANKEHHYQEYILKRYQLLQAGINLLEIDLLRAGKRPPLAAAIHAPYVCILSRAREWPQSHLWEVSWAKPCPNLPVPLLPDDPDVILQLAPAIQQAYAVEFEGFVDYTVHPPEPLTPAWQEEIDAILRATQLR